MEVAGFDDERGLIAELGRLKGAAWEGGFDECEGWMINLLGGHVSIVDDSCPGGPMESSSTPSGSGVFGISPEGAEDRSVGAPSVGYVHSICRGVGMVRMVLLMSSGVMCPSGSMGVELTTTPQMLGSSLQRSVERMRWSVRSGIIEGVSQRMGSIRRGISG